MAFPAVGVPCWSLANALSRILCLVITMGGKEKRKKEKKPKKSKIFPPKRERKKKKIEAWCGC